MTASARNSELEFARARRAVELGWTTESRVEAAVVAEDEAPPGARVGVVARLGLSDAQRFLLDRAAAPGAAPIPDEVARALRDPARAIGAFVVIAPLGSGGMGEVVRAYDTRLGRQVALKLLRRFHDERARACFEREARLAARLELPDIATIYEVGEHDGRPWIAMQLVDGRTLATLAAEGLGVRRAVELIRDAARAVDRAHRQGVVHRDLKPGNLMLDRNGRVIVLDFGLARPTEDLGPAGSTLTGSGFVIGTPEYMAPEQARGSPSSADARSDVYALGASLFELLARRPPFTSRDRGEILAQVLRDPPPRPSEVASHVPGALDAIVLRCLEKEPARRYASAGELGDDLDRFLGDVSAPTTPITMPARRPLPAGALPEGEGTATGTGRGKGTGRGNRSRTTKVAIVAGIAVAAAVAVVVWRLSGSGGTAPAAPAPAPGPALRDRRPTLVWQDRSAVKQFLPGIAIEGDRLYAGAGDGRQAILAALPLGGGPPIWISAVPESAEAIALLGDELFWIDMNSAPNTGTRIYARRKDGRGEPRVVYEGRPGNEPILDGSGLATDGKWLFAVDQVGGRLYRVDPTSSVAPLLLAGPHYPGGFATSHVNRLAVGGAIIYGVDVGYPGVTPPKVLAIAAVGGPPQVLWSGPPFVEPKAIAVRDGTVYVGDPGAGNTIFALPATVGGAPTPLAAGPPFSMIAGLAVAGDGLYVTDLTDAAVYRIDIGP